MATLVAIIIAVIVAILVKNKRAKVHPFGALATSRQLVRGWPPAAPTAVPRVPFVGGAPRGAHAGELKPYLSHACTEFIM